MKIKTVTEDKILFEDGSTLESHHQSECCEDHYVEFTSINGQGWEGKEFPDSLDVLVRKADGIETAFYDDITWRSFVELLDVYGNVYVLNIYNSNTGYYSSEVSLVLTKKHGNETNVERIDIQ